MEPQISYCDLCGGNDLRLSLKLHAVQFGNNWMSKILRTAKLDSAYDLVKFELYSRIKIKKLTNLF